MSNRARSVPRLLRQRGQPFVRGPQGCGFVRTAVEHLMEPPLGVLISAAPGCDLRLVEEAEDQLPLAFGASETARRLIRPLGCVPVAVLDVRHRQIAGPDRRIVGQAGR